MFSLCSHINACTCPQSLHKEALLNKKMNMFSYMCMHVLMLRSCVRLKPCPILIQMVYMYAYTNVQNHAEMNFVTRLRSAGSNLVPKHHGYCLIIYIHVHEKHTRT